MGPKIAVDLNTGPSYCEANHCINELSCEISCPKGQRSASPLHVNFLENMFQDSLLQNNRL